MSTDTREATPRPAMEARERLARVICPWAFEDGVDRLDRALRVTARDGTLEAADRIVAAFNISFDAALALMDDPGIGQKLSMAMTFKREIARRPQGVAASPYKETAMRMNGWLRGRGMIDRRRRPCGVSS